MPPVPPLGIEYAAWPPEVNTGKLQTGPGEAPMLQAAAGWEAWAVALEAQAAELSSALASLSAAWTGTGSDTGVAACMPMVMWLHTLSAQAMKRAAQATAQAASYVTAATTTPQIPEIMDNHVTHGVLEATNFLGVNAVPIGVNEADYMRMWNLAAATMYAYMAETTMNTLFEPIMPINPIVIPGVGAGVVSAAVGQAAVGMAGGAVRDAAFAHVMGQATVESVGLNSGRGVNMVNMAATDAEGASNYAQQGAQQGQNQTQQATQQVMQMGSQMGSQLMQLPQSLGSMVQSPLQQLTSPLQQVSSMFSSMGGSMGSGNQGAQMGFLGAGPMSNHPLAGGSGASSGAGLVRAASLPGLSGSSPRTPVMAKLIEKVEPAAVEPVVGAAGGSATVGSAPVGAGSGGAGPMGMGSGHAPKTGGTKTALKAPAPLVQDLGEDEGDDW